MSEKLPMKKLTLLTAIILASGCASDPAPIAVELQLPPELVLPKIDPTALACLPDQAYTDLVKRDKLQTERRETLRAIIQSTNKQE